MEAIGKIKNDFVIEGIVTDVHFKSQDNGYCIISLKAENKEDIPEYARNFASPQKFVACGIIPSITKGQRIEIEGLWVRHQTRGWRLELKSYKEIVTQSYETLIDYLCSGLFKGIGKRTARAIVETFKDRTLEVIKNNPQELTMVKGISSGKACNISRALKDAESLEKLMLSLRPYEIPTSKIVSIHQRYLEKAMEKIIENPYRLCDEFEGIGFKTAEKIANSCKFNPNDDRRIRAGILYALNESANNEGHIYLPFEVLVTKVKALLEQSDVKGLVERNNVIRVSVDLNNAKEIIIESDGSVYLPLYYNSEVAAGRKVRVLVSSKPKKFIYPITESIEKLEKNYNIKYAPKQKEAFCSLPNSNMLVITGGPGTGKTTIIKGIISIYKENFPECKISLAAPTGRAAKRMEEATKMEAKTIHRLLDFRPYSDEGLTCKKDENDPIDADLIIVDESSMVDLLLFSTFLKAVKPTTSVIFVGDTDQLPSVGAGNVLKDLIESNKVPVVCLNQIFRQADTSKIIINADKINRGDIDLELGEDFVFIEEKAENIPAIIDKTFLEEFVKVRDINEVQILSPFRKSTDTGVDRLNDMIQQSFNPKDETKTELKYGFRVFRQYDKVMQYKNNYDKEIYNGDTGIISSIFTANGENQVIVDMDGEDIEYNRDDLDEIQLAYATTIHKSQGCEYDVVVIPVCMEHRKMLMRNLLYTGITRAKKKVVLIGERKALNYCISNNMINSRFSKLNERI